MPFAVVLAEVNAALVDGGGLNLCLISGIENISLVYLPGLGQVADGVISFALHELDFYQELLVVEFLKLLEQLRTQTNSFGESVVLIVKTDQSDLNRITKN